MTPTGRSCHTFDNTLSQNGAAVLELGEGQATYVSERAREAGLKTSLRLDLAAIPRAIVLTPCDREKIVWQC